MATSYNAKVSVESGQAFTDYTLMTDSGDYQVYTVSGGTLWSGKSGFTPTVRPNGIWSGRNVLSTNAANDTVTVAAFKAYIAGTSYTVSATTCTFTRPATATKAKVYSITLSTTGATVASTAGTISATQAFSETRAAAGGPPLIKLSHVEIGQVRVTTSTAALVASSEIYQVVGTHTERSDYPQHEVFNVGKGQTADTSAETYAHIKFDATNPLIHTGPATRRNYIQYYTPQFSDLSKAVDFVPADTSASVSSTQVYRNKTIASSSISLNAGGFTAYLDDGVTDLLVAEKGQVLTIKFFPDQNKSAYTLTQGICTIVRSYPVDNQNEAAVNIAAENETADFSG